MKKHKQHNNYRKQSNKQTSNQNGSRSQPRMAPKPGSAVMSTTSFFSLHHT
jgi:hypothetical protein